MNTKSTINKVKKVLKKLISTYSKKSAEQASFQTEIDENALNEALEARLAELLARAPSSNQIILSLQLEAGHQVSVYSGCQVAGPQLR